jgi:type VI secretion system secreted protein Hcp
VEVFATHEDRLSKAVLISSFTSQSGDGMPSESISLNFTKIEYSYSPQKADGSLDTAIKATYDLKANKK